MDDKSTAPKFSLKACLQLVITLVVAYVLLVFISIMLLEVIASFSLWPAKPIEADLQIGLKIVSSVLNPILMLSITLLLLKRYFPTESYGDLFAQFGLGAFGSKWTLLFSLVLGMALALAVKHLVSMDPPDPSTSNGAYAVVSEAPLWAQLVLAINLITLVPLAEEFVFRGVLYKGIALSSNKLIAAISVSVLFTLAHVDTLSSGYWPNQTAVAILPIVLVIAREMTGSIYSSISIHSGFNFGSIFIV